MVTHDELVNQGNEWKTCLDWHKDISVSLTWLFFCCSIKRKGHEEYIDMWKTKTEKRRKMSFTWFSVLGFFDIKNEWWLFAVGRNGRRRRDSLIWLISFLHPSNNKTVTCMKRVLDWNDFEKGNFVRGTDYEVKAKLTELLKLSLSFEEWKAFASSFIWQSLSPFKLSFWGKQRRTVVVSISSCVTLYDLHLTSPLFLSFVSKTEMNYE